MNIFSAIKKRSSGFTMIELLIVIAILGILAVAVLAAINPIEQINRGRDTGSRGDAEQLVSAIERYNAFQGVYPWQETSSSDTELKDSSGLPIKVALNWTPTAGTSTFMTCPMLLVLGDSASGIPNGCPLTISNELKSSFISRLTSTTYNYLYVYNSGDTGASTYVCFNPKSAAFAQEARKRCNESFPADLNAIKNNICLYGGAKAFNDQDQPLICLP